MDEWMNFSNYLENLVAATPPPTPSVGFVDQEQRDTRNKRGLSQTNLMNQIGLAVKRR